MEIITTLIKLALSDLKAARILYSEKQFRASYFLFQQASEKATKAFALKFGLIKEENLKVVGHNQFKILRNYIIEKIKDYEKITKDDKNDPSKFAVKYQGLTNSLINIDKLRNLNLVNISSKDLDILYKEFEVFKTSFQKRRPQINEYFKKSKESKHINEMSLFLLQWPQNFYFILFALFACGILTTQHSSLARYPENGKNPLNIYTAKLPLIKKQILFMDLLEDAIKRLTRHSTESF